MRGEAGVTTYFDKQAETMSRDELSALQGKRLQAMVRRVYEQVPFYRRKLGQAGLHPDAIASIDDLARLPFTVKTDFRDNYPFGLFAVPLDDVIRLHASSGTTGKPTVVGYTRGDIDLWAGTCARTLACGGGTKKDVVQVAYGYGLFTGGLGMHYGGEKLGAAVIPMSGGNTKRQIMLMQDFGTTLLCCTPSYALEIAEVAQDMGVDVRRLPLKAGFFGAEPWTQAMRAAIEERLGLKAFDIYGLSEVTGPGVSAECEAHAGLHVFEDHFYPEIIDPQTGRAVPDGTRGELVFTCLTKEALPLIRYRTRDITSIEHAPCACGRTLARMARVSGRTDDMLIIRGTNVFPSQIESVLLEVEDIEPQYLIIVDRKGTLDELEIQVEVNERVFSDEIKRLEDLRKRIASEIYSTLGLTAKVTLVEPKTIERSQGKARRVIDKRAM
jgi:phenylacetate-CoA ligase